MVTAGESYSCPSGAHWAVVQLDGGTPSREGGMESIFHSWEEVQEKCTPGSSTSVTSRHSSCLLWGLCLTPRNIKASQVFGSKEE